MAEPVAVSVIMPCYNSAATIGTSIDSALGQSLRALELIVIDDGSTDDSAAVVEERAKMDSRVKLLRQANAGPAAARNRGLRAASGDLVAFLDADDTWAPECLARLHAALRADPAAALAYCGWQNLGLSPQRDRPFVPPDYEGTDKVEVFLTGCRWPIHAALTRKSAIDAAGGFDESLRASMDFDLWLRLATVHRIVRVPEVLAFYHHRGGGQITRDRVRIAFNHMRAQEKFLAANPDVARALGPERVRRILYGELLHRAYTCYWARDLPAARTLFRRVMRAGYGRARDWRYMLPCLLPQPLHARLIALASRH